MGPARCTRFHLPARVWAVLLSLVTLALVGSTTWLAGSRADQELRADLLRQARIVATSLSPERLAGLSGTAADVAAANYQRLKGQLDLLRRADARCRFIYLMRRGPDEMVVLLVDSEPADSPDCSPPGQAYVEAPRELHDVFTTGQDAVRGPYSDRWGTWVSAFVLLPASPTDGARTVLGLDIGAAGWRRIVTARAGLLAALAAAAMLLGLLAVVLYLGRRETREHKDELETLLRRMINAFVVFDPVIAESGEFVTCRFVYINDAYERIVGVRRDDVTGKTLHEVWPGTESGWVKAFREVALTGVPREFDMYHGPTAKLYHCRAYRPGSERARFCVILEDITQGRRLEEAIQRERGNLRAVLDASPVGMLVFDEHEDVLFANPAAEAMFGTSRRDSGPRKCGDFLRCANREEAPGGCGNSGRCPPCGLAAAIQGALSGDPARATGQGEALVTVQAAAKPMWLSFRTSAAVVSGQRWAVMALDDITERKHAEEQIRTLLAASDQARQALLGLHEGQVRAEAERKRLAAAIEQAAEAIVITDAQALIQYVNPAFEAMTGYRREEAIGQNPRLLKSGQQDAAFYRELWDTISSGRTWTGRFVNQAKDGTQYTEDATISPVRDPAGAIVNYVAVKRDITEHLRLQARLLQAQRLESIGTLASGVAHEVNNPIMGIMNYAQLIRDAATAGSPTAEFADGIIHETQRVATIVRSLLQLARQDEDTHRTPARLSDILADTLSLIRAVLRHDQTLLQVDVPADLPPIRCRSQQIRQVILNLLTNARAALNEKYPGGGPDKRISIRASEVSLGVGGPSLGADPAAAGLTHDAERPRCGVRLTIEDRGTGIPESLRGRVFEPFYSTKGRAGGTGLGLAISYGIVTDHGGQLSVESEVGQWTRFHLDLPTDDAPEVASEAGDAVSCG